MDHKGHGVDPDYKRIRVMNMLFGEQGNELATKEH